MSESWRSLVAFGDIASASDLCSVVRAIVAAGVVPTRYGGTDGGRRLVFSEEAFEADSEALFASGVVYLSASEGSLEATLSMRFRPRISIWVRDAGEEAAKREWLNLAEVVHSMIEPEFLVVGWGDAGPVDARGHTTWTTDRERDQALYAYAHDPTPLTYYQRKGLLGVGVRTYLCSHFLELLGGEGGLSGLPGPVAMLDSGGVRIDIADGVSSASHEELLEAWLSCMDSLAPQGLFIAPDIDDDGKFIDFLDGAPRFSRPGTSV